jgi:hypothetical protein
MDARENSHEGHVVTEWLKYSVQCLWTLLFEKRTAFVLSFWLLLPPFAFTPPLKVWAERIQSPAANH